ncbi:hypothetical protein RhiLY_09172 [Ceratobasidium sp. AG-Ba]|nr:hypothetical protein RhiLY_09172 [Ceratobasidium sp. AG-Ba]
MGAPSLDELNAIAGPYLSPDKSLNLGPFIIAMGLDAVLGGILVMQCGSYKSLAQFDPYWVKSMVLYVLVMNVAITFYTWAWIYDLFVYNFGTYGMFLSVKYLAWYYVLDSATVIVVQGFFAVRAWRLVNNNLLVLFVIGAFALAAFGGGITVKVMFTAYGSTLHAGDVKVPAYIWLFCTVVADLTITVIILYFLFKNRTGWRATDDILSRLTRITFESQLPPTLIATGLAIEYSIKYDSFIAIPFICVQAKFYGISLMHTLNGRLNVKRNDPTSEGSGSRSLPQKSSSNNAYLASSSAKRSHSHHIQVETTVVRDTASHQMQLAQGPQNIALENMSPGAGQNLKRQPSDDGLSLDSSTYKVVQDDVEKGGAGEYKLENLAGGGRRKEVWDDHSRSQLPL